MALHLRGGGLILVMLKYSTAINNDLPERKIRTEILDPMVITTTESTAAQFIMDFI